MNYERIYREFIADRRAIEDATELVAVYSEKHHIKPRSLGGDDSPENLIRLTPEDHFFAHLLLAEIHGGEMWAPIALMVGGSRKDYKPTQSRKAHGWAARAMAKARCGSMAYQFDRKVYDLVHKDGRTVRVLQSEMHTQLGIGRPLANMLVKGRVSVAKGWYLKGTEPKSSAGTKHPMHRPEVHEFRHVNGDTFTGTQLEFSDSKGVRRPDASRLVTGVYAVTQGWYMAVRGLPESPHVRAKWLKHANI